jgi:hypothetical protein
VLALLAQVVLAFPAEAAPVRFGAPVPERALAAGLRLRDGGALFWRPLPLAARDGQRWVEIAVVGATGRARVEAGGSRPETAPAVARSFEERDGSTVTEWRYCDGSADWRRRTVFEAPTVVHGEAFAAGEARTEESLDPSSRALPVLSLPRALWEQHGLLPRDLGLCAEVRAHLQRAAHALVELPGVRGAGDHARSGGVVTNLEFDTTLALVRLAVALQDEGLLRRARRAAFHLVDRDLDARTGLPFAHGPDHRSSPPQPGHVWLQGLLWVGALCAEDHLLAAAGQIARSLAATPPVGEGEDDRARDWAWPLLELEHYLRWCDDRTVASAADRLAAAIAARFDPALHTFRFGEGSVRGPGYFERGWITGGVVVPALRAHLQRRPHRELQAIVDDATAALRQRIGQGRGGLPTHWRVVPGAVFAEHRAERDPKAFLLLEALPAAELRRLLRRTNVLEGLLGTPSVEDPDLPTSLAMAARCAWVYR